MTRSGAVMVVVYFTFALDGVKWRSGGCDRIPVGLEQLDRSPLSQTGESRVAGSAWRAAAPRSKV